MHTLRHPHTVVGVDWCGCGGGTGRAMEGDCASIGSAH